MKKTLVAVLVLILFFITGCSADKEGVYIQDEYEPQDVIDDISDPVQEEQPGGDILATSSSPALLNRKIIYKSTMSLISSDLPTTYNEVVASMAQYDSYFEAENINSDRYVLKIRVLSENLMDLIDDIKGSGELITYTKTSEDVTNKYSTYQANYDALLIQYDQVEQLFINATTESSQIKYLDRLTEINSEILAVADHLNNYDSLVDYSTIDLTITRVENKNSLLDDSSNPSITYTNLGKKSFILEIHNNSENSAEIFINIKENGVVVKTFTREAYAESYETFEVDGLKSNTEYKVEVYTLEDNHLPSEQIVRVIETDSTYFSRLGNTLMSSLNGLLTVVEFVIIVVVALLPFAIVGVLLFIPSRLVYRKYYKKSKEV